MLLKKTNFPLFNSNSRLRRGAIRIAATNNLGRKTMYHRGSGSKNSIRIIDYSRYIINIPALVLTFEYSPRRTAPLSLISYANGALAYILSVHETYPGSIIITSQNATYKNEKCNVADCYRFNYLRPGLYINNIHIKTQNSFSQYVRAGGLFAKLVSVARDGYAVIKLKSKTLLKLNINNLATVGTLMSTYRIRKKRAGVNRRLGKRPHVRGVAMNPVDHPHGGGQGKTSGGRPSVTPWALTTKGRKTRRKYNYAKTIMKR